MRYLDLKNKISNYPFIIAKDLERLEKDPQPLRNQLTRWQRKGLLLKLKRGLLILNEGDRKIAPSKPFIASQLYAPSYVSLEYALSHYGLIPEQAADVTSITTKKTARFANPLGVFVYQNIKPQAFQGFRLNKDSAGMPFFIAEPEKALLDYLYLNLSRIPTAAKTAGAGPEAFFNESLRLQNTGQLKQKRLIELARLFRSPKLQRLMKPLLHFIREGAV